MDSNSSDKRGKEPKNKKTGTKKNILKESTENKFTNQFITSNQASKLNLCSGNWPNDNLKNYNNKMKALSVNAQEFVPTGWLNQQQPQQLKKQQQNNANIEINQPTSNLNLFNSIPYNQSYNTIPQAYTPIW